MKNNFKKIVKIKYFNNYLILKIININIFQNFSTKKSLQNNLIYIN